MNSTVCAVTVMLTLLFGWDVSMLRHEYIGGICGSGIESSAHDELEMRMVRGIRGVECVERVEGEG